MSSDKIKPAPYLYPFPEPTDVFSSNVDIHRRHLLPLISFDAAHVDSTWQGKLHIVSPKESFDGMVGEYCEEYHNKWCGNDILAFKVEDDGKYSFLTDFRYFVTERGIVPDAPSYLSGFIGDVSEHYDEVEREFAKTKQFYMNRGVLNPNSSRQPDRNDSWLKFPEEPTFYNNRIPVLENAKQLRFVAQATGYSYYGGGPTSLLLYYDHVERIAVIQLDHD